MTENKSVVTDIAGARPCPRVIALGAFDGVHLAHRAVISAAREEALKNGARPCVFTFYTDPSYFLGKPQKLLNTPEERFARIREAGAEEIICAEFDGAMSETGAEEFYEMLRERLTPVCLVCGHNYTFGKSGCGDTGLLAELCERDRIRIKIVDRVTVGGEPVSSSRIRNLIAEGRVEEAGGLLGYEYSLSGTVVEGRKLGRKLGFPTANIEIPANMAVPSYGVYVSRVEADGKIYKAVTDIGMKPTVGTDKPISESHLLDGEENLYGREIKVSFVRRIRGEMRFSGTEELARRISEDAAEARRYFESERPAGAL